VTPEGGRRDPVWAFKAAGQVQCLAASGAVGWSLVADQSRNIYVLNEAGSSRGVFRAGQPVRRLRADAGGALFSALAGDTIIYAFNVQAQLEWRVELGGPAADFDLDTAAERLAAVSAGGWLYLYSPQTRERQVAPVGWPMASVGLAGANPLRVAVCNDGGRVAMLNGEGKPEWQKDLGGKVGGLSVSVGGDMIVVAAHEQGIVLFRLNGEEIGRLDLGQPVLRAEVTPNGALIMAETAQDRLVLTRPDSTTLWEQTFGGPLAGWAMAAGGRIAVVAAGGREVTAYTTGQAGPERTPLAERREKAPPKAEAPRAPVVAGAAAAPAKGPEAAAAEGAPDIEEIEWPDYIEIESTMASSRAQAAAVRRPPAAPKPSASPKPSAPREPSAPLKPSPVAQREATPSPSPAPQPQAMPKPAASPKPAPPTKRPERVAWKVRLPDSGLPVQESLFRLSEDGAFMAVALANGTALVLDGEGKAAVRAEVGKSARLAPRALRHLAGLWTPQQLVVLDPAAGSARTVVLVGAPVRLFDCSADLTFCCTVDENGIVSAFQQPEAPLWQRESRATPTGLLVSAGGGTVLVSDGDGRFLYYSADGRLMRKFRFGEDERHEALALHDAFSVFVGAEGRLTVLDADGRQMWSRRLFSQVAGLEVLGEALAVYGDAGACAHVDPREGTVWEMLPPPGRVRLRKPAGSDPLVVHAAGSVVTVFRGYRRKLDVVWRHDCEEDVSALDADADAHAVVALAGQKVYRVEGTAPS